MKILTGALRGKAIGFRPNPHLRPTADKVRKAIFDMLQGALEGRRVLDLFSGTGALGFEALSGGATEATFVEKDRAQCRKIEENAEALGLSARARVFCGDAVEAVGRLAREGGGFDVAFADAPYARGLGLRALEALASPGVLADEAIVVFECDRREEIPAAVGRLRCEKEKEYGDTKVRLFRT